MVVLKSNMSLTIQYLDRQSNLEVSYHRIDSPTGVIYFGMAGKLLVYMNFQPPKEDIQPIKDKFGMAVRDQMAAYFQGELKQFDLVVGISGTRFDQQVLTYVSEIPFGETCSYKDIAMKFEDPKLSRAVGSANGRNKILMVIPCHRVIGGNGDLTGYAGGLANKKWLLSFEKNTVSNQLSIF